MATVETKTTPKSTIKEFKSDTEYRQAVQESYKKYKDHGKLSFASFGRDSQQEQRPTLRNKYTKENIQQWFTNPDQHEKELRQLSSYMYISNGMVKQIINFYTNLPTLDYVISPKFIDFKDKEKVDKEYNKVFKYCDDVLEKPTLRIIIKSILKDNCYFGYERKSNGVYFIQKLNPEYCRQGRLIQNIPTIEFDFSYFKGKESKLSLYDIEFTDKYNDYKNNNGEQWQELNYKKTMCIPLESEDYNFPLLTGIFDDLIDLEEFYQYLKESTELDTNKLLIQEVLINKDTGELMVDPDTVDIFHDAIAEILPKKARLVSTPFNVKSENMTQSKMQQNNGIPEMERLIASNTGISQSVLSSGDGATALKMNFEVNTAFIFSIIEKIEIWLKRRLARLTVQKYPFTVEFLRTTNVNRQDVFNMSHKMLSIGGSLDDLASAKGMNPRTYEGLLRMEIHRKIKDLLQIPQSIYTSSGKDNKKEAGREKLDETDLSESGEQTRDLDDRK